MSVRSEFDRIVGNAIACLRAGGDPAQALALELQHARAGASADLAGAATRVLELWEGRRGEDLVDPDARAALEDAAERMIAVSNAVLGR